MRSDGALRVESQCTGLRQAYGTLPVPQASAPGDCTGTSTCFTPRTRQAELKLTLWTVSDVFALPCVLCVSYIACVRVCDDDDVSLKH